ncbi:type II secretion system protein [Candidatus Saccharibacteria bacterium]|nr:type II secretion system protein [Candidatus Saccharibacteria bacterium]
MKRGDKKGFTIIEVSLVLAIAGLILMMVFIALPALRRTQRDSARKDDIMVFLKKVKDFQTNNRGALPTGGGDTAMDYTWDTDSVNKAADASWGGFLRDYMGENFVDPDGVHYNLVVAKCAAAAVDAECIVNGMSNLNNLSDLAFPNGYKLIVVTQAACSGEKAVGVANPRKVAVMYRLEGAGVYCANT